MALIYDQMTVVHFHCAQSFTSELCRRLPQWHFLPTFALTAPKCHGFCHTRPEVCYFANTSAQVTEHTFSPANVKSFNAVLENLRKTADRKLFFQNLDINTLRIVAYSDASFANRADLSSQLAFVIILSDASRKRNVINYRSYKSRRVTHSVLGGEILAFAEPFDCAYTLRKDIEKMLGRKLPLSFLTDSKSLFDIITKSSSTLEKRVMIDVAVARESYAKEELSDIALLRGELNLADALTIESPATRKVRNNPNIWQFRSTHCPMDLSMNIYFRLVYFFMFKLVSRSVEKKAGVWNILF
jgi:hypothetical protein